MTCSKWSTFTNWLDIRVRKSKENIKKQKEGNFPPLESDIEKSVMDGANVSRKDMEEKGVINLCLGGVCLGGLSTLCTHAIYE